MEIQIESRTEEQPLNYKLKILKLSLNTDELLFIAGGYDSYLQLLGFELYSPFQYLKKPLTSMNFSRLHASTANLNDELYVFGGLHGDSWYDIGMPVFLTDFSSFLVYCFPWKQ